MRNARYVSNDAKYLLSRAKQPDEISPATIFRVSPVPALDLEANISLPLRAYVLKCRNGKHYVGISPAHKIKSRIHGHFSGDAMDASHFCEKNPPISVLCVWPVRHEAAEAYSFFVVMQALKCTDFRNLGGFVFTSSKPSPLEVCTVYAKQIFKSFPFLFFLRGVLFRSLVLSLVGGFARWFALAS